MNWKTFLGMDKDIIQQTSLTLVKEALKSESEVHITHLNVKDEKGKKGNYEVVVKKLDATPMHHDSPMVVERPDSMKPPMPGAVESNDYYVLLIDKDRDELLNIMLQAMRHIQAIAPTHEDQQRVVTLNETIKTFGAEVAKKHHEKGWCSDPNCTYQHKKKI